MGLGDLGGLSEAGDKIRFGFEHPVLAGMLSDSRQSDVVLVEGARQVGKSTLVSQMLAEMECPKIAIDLEKDRKIARLTDKTADFEDFRLLLRDQRGLKENGGILCTPRRRCLPP